jgi:hypothetical protein
MLRFLNSFVNRFSRSLSNKDTINILKILTCLIKYYNQSGIQLFKKYFKTLRNLPRFLNFLPHVFEKLDFFRGPAEFKKNQKIFLIFFFVNLTNFDLLLLEKLINKVKVNGLFFLIDKVNFKDCNSQITPASICKNLNLEGYSDWVLPSATEMQFIVKARLLRVPYFLGVGTLWTSTEKNSDEAYYINVSELQTINIGDKNQQFKFVAIRYY